MNPIYMNCPECGGRLLVSAGQFPMSSVQSGDKYEVVCPLCSSCFNIGYISNFKKVEQPAQPVPKPPEEISYPEGHGTGSGAMKQVEKISSNDQRSNALNANNSAFSAPRNNRSNQMNPNNPAYGSSRRHY